MARYQVPAQLQRGNMKRNDRGNGLHVSRCKYYLGYSQFLCIISTMKITNYGIRKKQANMTYNQWKTQLGKSTVNRQRL